MQVYRQMDVGTAKASLQEQDLIPHHQLDLINPDENYSAGQYARDTSGIIKKIQERGRLPILVGGTGLYYRALMYGISKIPPVPENLRKEITGWQQEHGTPYCHKLLQKYDPEGAELLHPNDTSRILRSLEVVLSTGKSIYSYQLEQPFGEARYPFHAVALNWDRNDLYQRINKRTLSMLGSGWLAEVEMLLNSYSPELKPMQSIGYREVVQYLQNKLSWDAMVEEIQKRTRQLAKRQLTWFRREAKIKWYKPFEQDRILADIKVYLEN
jgi:tRNA dimethylallyltransferase